MNNMLERHSILDVSMEVEAKIRDTISQLTMLWDEIDMKDSMRLKRVDTAFKHIINICDEILDGEKEMVTSLRTSIREYSQKINKMRDELGMSPYEKPENVRDNSIALLRNLQVEIESLQVQYNQRHEEQKELIEKIINLRKRLDVEVDFTYDTTVLFAPEVHKKYDEDREELEETLRSRYSRVECLQQEIKKWCQVSKDVSNNDYLINNLTMLHENIDAIDYVFSQNLINSYEELSQKLKPIYIEWLENMQYRWTEAYSDIAQLWDKCMVPDEQRCYEESFVPGKHNEKVLEEMIEESENLRSRYVSRKPVFDGVEQWKTFWIEKLAIDQKRRVPDYYNKVNVLPDNKRERELMQLMANTEKEIQQLNKAHDEKHPEDPILICSMRPLDYIDSVKEDHRYELKAEFQLKKDKKQKSFVCTPKLGKLKKLNFTMNTSNSSEKGYESKIVSTGSKTVLRNISAVNSATPLRSRKPVLCRTTKPSSLRIRQPLRP